GRRAARPSRSAAGGAAPERRVAPQANPSTGGPKPEDSSYRPERPEARRCSKCRRTHVQPISPEKTTDRGRRPDAASAARSVGAGVRGERCGAAAPGPRGDAQEDPGGGPGAAPPARPAEGRLSGDAEEGRRGRNQRPDG